MHPTKILEFPAIAATNSGSALMTFTLSGPDYYPSTAYAWLTSNQATIHITALGKSPQDGFTEYQFFATGYAQLYLYRPRWGDYRLGYIRSRNSRWNILRYKLHPVT